MSEQVKLSEPVDSASIKPKRKNNSIIDLIFSPKHKRSKTSEAEARVDRKMSDDTNKREGASVKKTKPSLEKSRKKEVKARLNDEASKEIPSLTVGTLAMMASALSNQGRCRASCRRDRSSVAAPSPPRTVQFQLVSYIFSFFTTF